MRKSLVSLFLLFEIGCSSPTAPTYVYDCPPINIEPKKVFLRVGESTVFSAEGGDGTGYDFMSKKGDENTAKFIKEERVALNQIRITAIRRTSPDSIRIYLYVMCNGAMWGGINGDLTKTKAQLFIE